MWFDRRVTGAGQHYAITQDAADRAQDDTYKLFRRFRLISPCNGDQVDVSLKTTVHGNSVALKPRSLSNCRKDGIKERSTESASCFTDGWNIVLAHVASLPSFPSAVAFTVIVDSTGEPFAQVVEIDSDSQVPSMPSRKPLAITFAPADQAGL